MPLATIEQFAGYLKRGLTDFDAYTAQLMLDGACSAVADYCGWHIAPAVSQTVTVDGSRTRLQPLPTMNLLDVTAVTEDGFTVDVARLDWSENGLLEKRSGSVWTGRRRGVTADIRHGYPSAPGWILTLVCAVAGRAFISPLGVQQEAAGGESITYAVSPAALPGTITLTNTERRMLDRIRIPGAAS